MANKRIFVTATEDQVKILDELADKETRPRSFVATRIFNDGMELLDKPEPVLSYQQRIADGLVKKKEG